MGRQRKKERILFSVASSMMFAGLDVGDLIHLWPLVQIETRDEL